MCLLFCLCVRDTLRVRATLLPAYATVRLLVCLPVRVRDTLRVRVARSKLRTNDLAPQTDEYFSEIY